MRYALALLLCSGTAAAAPKQACDDDVIPVDGGTFVLHDCVLDTRPGKTAEFEEHTRLVTLRFAPLGEKPIDATLGGVRDGFGWRERWRIVAVLKDETAPSSGSMGQAVVLARETGAETGDLCEVEVRALSGDLAILWEGSAQWAYTKVETERSRVRIRGKRATPSSDLDELALHGKASTVALALREGRIVDVTREKWR